MYPEGVLKKPYHPDEIIRRINILRDRRAPRPA
jgi:DNA-binding response OmpR family regulator